jgi:succinoglycan biosynthesis protein ExoM
VCRAIGAHAGRSPAHIRVSGSAGTSSLIRIRSPGTLYCDVMPRRPIADTGPLAVCIATHKRPQGLERLINGLQALTFERAPEPAVEIVVVDNDPAGSAKATCDRLAQTSRWPLFYVSEPRRGISFARNAAMEKARSRHAQYIAFIDDDEAPSPAWLDELLAGLDEYDAGVVAGPVLPMFESPVAPWMVKGKFFERARSETGSRRATVATCNVLFKTRVFDDGVGGFDETLGLTGGEDSDFFLRVANAGYPIVWIDSAIVHEWNPPTRTRTRWILRRAFNVGNNWAGFKQNLRPSARMALRGLAKGLLLLPVSVVRGRHEVVSSMELVATGVGYLVGKSGLRFERYRKTDGK